MLLKEFMLDNVSVGKGSIKIPMKGFIEEMHERYDEMSKNNVKPFLHAVYTVTPGDRMIVHVKVPSRSLATKFYYDVLLELEPLKNAVTIRDCHVKIFSDSPSFVYSYAYVFYHLDPNGQTIDPKKTRKGPGLLINKLQGKIPADRLLMPAAEKKLGDEVLKNPPVVRNPHNLPLFDSSIYLAIIYLEDVTTLPQLQRQAKRITENQLMSSIPEFDKLMEERKKIARKESDKKKQERAKIQATFKEHETKLRRLNNTRNVLKPKAPISARKPSGMKKPRSTGK